MIKVVTIPARRALDIAAERWGGRAVIKYKFGEGWKRAAATAIWCFKCSTRVAVSAAKEHVFNHMRRK